MHPSHKTIIGFVGKLWAPGTGGGERFRMQSFHDLPLTDPTPPNTSFIPNPAGCEKWKDTELELFKFNQLNLLRLRPDRLQPRFCLPNQIHKFDLNLFRGLHLKWRPRSTWSICFFCSECFSGKFVNMSSGFSLNDWDARGLGCARHGVSTRRPKWKCCTWSVWKWFVGSWAKCPAGKD